MVYVMKSISYIAIFLLLCSNAQAFLNIESLRQQKSKKPGLLGSTGLRLNDQKGNVDKTLFQLNTLNRLSNGKSHYIFLGQYRYGKSFSQEDTRQGHLHFRYTRQSYVKVASEYYIQSEFNKFENLSLRLLGGAGLRFRLYSHDKISLFSGLGAFYEREDLENDRDPENPRGNIYLSSLIQIKDSQLSSTLYYQPNTDDFNDFRFRFNIGLETLLLKNLSQSIEYTIRRDTRPPSGILKTDAQLTAGLHIRY
jgi:hypothetical protein